jgi:predicted TIM-barrel fold metal-dependent hydrolase
VARAARLLSLDDIPLAVSELERCANMGLKGAMIWGVPPEDKPYYSEIYDPFWTAAGNEDAVVAARDYAARPEGQESRQEPGENRRERPDRIRRREDADRNDATGLSSAALSSFIFGKVFERFPELRIVSAENDTGWIAHFM